MSVLGLHENEFIYFVSTEKYEIHSSVLLNEMFIKVIPSKRVYLT